MTPDQIETTRKEIAAQFPTHDPQPRLSREGCWWIRACKCQQLPGDSCALIREASARAKRGDESWYEALTE